MSSEQTCDSLLMSLLNDYFVTSERLTVYVEAVLRANSAWPSFELIEDACYTSIRLQLTHNTQYYLLKRPKMQWL